MADKTHDVTLPVPLWSALARVVSVSGVARNALIAEAVAGYLVSRGALAPEELATLTPKKTRGRLAALTDRKGK